MSIVDIEILCVSSGFGFATLTMAVQDCIFNIVFSKRWHVLLIKKKVIEKGVTLLKMTLAFQNICKCL